MKNRIENGANKKGKKYEKTNHITTNINNDC